RADRSPRLGDDPAHGQEVRAGLRHPREGARRARRAPPGVLEPDPGDRRLRAGAQAMSAAKTSSARVLVTGATGNTGRAVAAGLAELGFTVRTATRHSHSPEPAAEHVRFD